MKPATFLAAGLLVCAGAAAAERDRDPPPLPPRDGESVILFLLDNSASLPPLDPQIQRREAIEKIYSFLKGQPYRLVLFGGRGEIHVDELQRYRSQGQWTDFYFAFEAARKVTRDYPPGTRFKTLLITDGKLDPSPAEWEDQGVPAGVDLKEYVGDRTIELLESSDLPLYVILIGREVDHSLIQRMVIAANGKIAASEYSQAIADFFADDGMLLQRFIFRLEENEGLDQIEPIVTRIATPPSPRVELSIAGSLLLAVAIFIGVGVRSFPGSGDREVLELRGGEPLYLAVDRLKRLSSDVPAWSWKGLSLVESSRGALATLIAQEDSTELPPAGFSLDALEPSSRELVGLSLPALRERLQHLAQNGSKDEQIYALNLEYVARDMEEARVERLVTASPSERKKLAAQDFLRAKVHLVHNDKLARKLTGASVICKLHGSRGQEQELRQGSRIPLGRYELRVDELARGGRKDFRLGLVYERVPSALFLKRIVPASVQRAIRLRRSHERTVR